MTAAIAHTPPKMGEMNVKAKRLISLDAFLRQYPNREDKYKYEWHKGIVEKTPRTMNRDQSDIQAAFLAYFYANAAFRVFGSLIVELDMYIPSEDRTRRADLAILTREQMAASKHGDYSVPPFVVEVISTNDKINEVEIKLNEYFNNGVQVVWQVFPLIDIVKVYTSPTNITICKGNDICSAAPVLPDFQMSVHQILGV
jgi:Uma2 family endonuclease